MSGTWSVICNHLIRCCGLTQEQRNGWQNAKDLKSGHKRRRIDPQQNSGLILPNLNQDINNGNNNNNNVAVGINNIPNNNNNNIRNTNVNAGLADRSSVNTQNAQRFQLSLKEIEVADQMCAEWTLNRPHIPFTEATNEYCSKFIQSINPTYHAPDRNRISGGLLTNYEKKLQAETKETVKNADCKVWGMQYDGTSDRCREKTVHVTFANPLPIIYASEPHDKTGQYTAHNHCVQMTRNYDNFLRDNVDHQVPMLMTDCESTMLAAIEEFQEDHPHVCG
eukprot:240917_1